MRSFSGYCHQTLKFFAQMLILVEVIRLEYRVGVICRMLRMVLLSLQFVSSNFLLLQGFQAPRHSHMVILVVFNQYRETILHLLQCFCLQRQESYLLSAQTLESISLSHSHEIMQCNYLWVDMSHQSQMYEVLPGIQLPI